MCTTCGCGQGEARIEGEASQHEHRDADVTTESCTYPHDSRYRYRGESGHSYFHVHADGTVHSHLHDHGRSHQHRSDLLGGHRLPAADISVLQQARIVQIEQDILAKNDSWAAQNRRVLHDLGIFAVNLVSSPGSGKTTLLVRTIEALRDSLAICVIEGDQQTSFDADRIRATGAAAIQINTGKSCHLDASMISRALERLDPQEGSALMIENVGNLVCPAGFDLGEAHKVVVLSVTEGEDKPLKYPDMFHAASLMLLNKIDLLPYLQFDAQRCIDYARRVNPDIAVLSLSATTGHGMGEWLAWVKEGVSRAQRGRRETTASVEPNVVSSAGIRS